MMENKFVESYSIDDYEIWTDTGWQDVTNIYKTIPFKIWKVTLENGLFLECADDHIVFKGKEEIFVKNLLIDDEIETVNGPSKVIEIIQTEIEDNMYDVTVPNGERFYSNGILSHNTQTTGAYVLWYSQFHEDKFIGIASNKSSSAKDYLNRIKIMYEELPWFLKSGVKEYNKNSIVFENGTRIETSGTTEDTFRGRSPAILVLDEFAFVRASIAEEFFTSIYPSISSSEQAKIIILSTPNGIGNLYHKLFVDAEAGKNTFKPLKVTWESVPGRDKEWAETQIKNLGPIKFSQEQGCTFVGSIATVIDAETLKRILTSYIYPALVQLENKFRIYKQPEDNFTYLIGVDIAKGTGEHYSVCQVLKVESTSPLKLEQVAVYENNEIDVYSFSEVIHRIACYYNKAYVGVENNMGDTVVSRLWWHYEYENLINESSKSTGLGIRATNKTKPTAVLLMKRLLESDNLIIYDKRTAQQLGIFVEKDGKFKGNDGADDDLVSGLYWGCYISQFDIFGDATVKINIQNDEDGWGLLSDYSFDEEIF